MNVKSAQIANNAFSLYIRMLITLGVSLYTSRVVLNELGVSDFGVYNVVGGVVGMLAFINNSMAGATARFLTFDIGRGNFDNLKKTFNLSISIHLLIGLIILILGETIGYWFVLNKLQIPEDRLGAAIWTYHAAMLSSVIGILTVPYVAILNAHEKMRAFSIISILEVILRLLIVLALPLLSYDKLKAFALLTSFVSIVVFLIYLIYCNYLFEETRVKRLVWDSKLFRQMAVFAGWVLNGNLAVVAYTQGINILLNIFFGPTINAARGIAIQVQNAVNNFSYNFQKAINPQITKSFAAGEFQRMHRLVFSGSKITFLLLLMVCLPICFDTRFILFKWLKIVPDYTVVFVQLTMVISLISTLSYSLIVSIHASGDIKRFQIWEGTILLMILPFSYLLLKLGFGPTMTIIIQLLFTIIAQIVRVFIVGEALSFSKLRYLKVVVLRLLVTVSLCLIVLFCINTFLAEGWSSLMINTVCSIISVGVFGYFFGLDNIEKEFVKGLIAKYRNREIGG